MSEQDTEITQPIGKKKQKRNTISVFLPQKKQELYKNEAINRNLSLSKFIQNSVEFYLNNNNNNSDLEKQEVLKEEEKPLVQSIVQKVETKEDVKDKDKISVLFKIPKEIIKDKVSLTKWMGERVNAVINSLFKK